MKRLHEVGQTSQDDSDELIFLLNFRPTCEDEDMKMKTERKNYSNPQSLKCSGQENYAVHFDGTVFNLLLY